MVPLDLSLESLRALDFALPLAKRFGARVHLVHVYEGAHQFSTIATSPLLWSEGEGKRHLADEVELNFGTRPQREIVTCGSASRPGKSSPRRRN